MRKRTLVTLLLPIAIAILAVNRSPNTGYAPILAVAVIGTELALTRIKKAENALVLFCLALSLLWSVTMWGDYIVGVDIHTEYYMVNNIIKNGWNVSYYNSNNTSFVLTFIAPFLANWIPVVWQFKIIYPMIFATMPVFLYLAYDKLFGHKIAWLACLYLITMPMYQFETTSMVKSMVGQTMLAAVIYLLTVKPSFAKTSFMVLAGVLAGLSHYAVAAIMSMYLIIISFLSPVLSWNKRSITITAAIVIILAANLIWYENTGQGSMLNTAKSMGQNISAASASLASNQTTELVEKYLDRTKPEEKKATSYLDKQEEIIRAAIGLDWGQVSLLGKIFRVIQYIAEIGLIVGVGVITVKRRKRQPLFVAGMIAGLLLLIACIFVPFLSTTASASRFYQLSLLFTSPAIIIGIKAILNGVGILWSKISL